KPGAKDPAAKPAEEPVRTGTRRSRPRSTAVTPKAKAKPAGGEMDAEAAAVPQRKRAAAVRPAGPREFALAVIEGGKPALAPSEAAEPVASVESRPGAERSYRVLMIASEAVPFSKTGGLGDVAGALPRALASRGHEVTLVLPRYRGIDVGTRPLTRFE